MHGRTDGQTDNPRKTSGLDIFQCKRRNLGKIHTDVKKSPIINHFEETDLDGKPAAEMRMVSSTPHALNCCTALMEFILKREREREGHNLDI